MVTNFLSTLNSLRGIVDEFAMIHRRSNGESTPRLALKQFQEELDVAREMLDRVCEGEWRFFPDEQRWGYLLLLSLVERGNHEIKISERLI